MTDLQVNSHDVARAAEQMDALRSELAKAVVGQADAVEQTLVALVASGHVLIEGVPGLGKTLLARALAQVLRLSYARVQFTPDLMPSDITGTDILEEDRA
ncbi:MAG TPA: AAA family ATPase, partial [Ramlibacter sp.]|nr:AAA family ATPase [Ramlibacter sp.]